MGMVDGHGDLERKKTLIGRVRVSKWGWSRAIGALEKETDYGWEGQGVWVGMIDGNGALEKEEGSDWAGQGLSWDGRWPWGF